MDKDTRNRIQRATQQARAVLEHEYAEQLEGTFDVRLDGTIASSPGPHLDSHQRVLRTKLVTAVEHQRAGGQSKPDAVAAYLRESAFTTLNRFVALKMLEARGLVQECVSRGTESSGFKNEFTGLAPGLRQLDHSYRIFIESLFDEIGREVRVLFDRRDPASLLWPRRQVLRELLNILNDNELDAVWGEDETVGWVYQYFNSDDERRQMRAESQAPRNSRELAVRNQFFTPRYVVQFLADNTLGRVWYEMRQGETKLRELQYLVRTPNEVFLSQGEQPPSEPDAEGQGLSQEELLARPSPQTFHAKKDPRDIRVLDPACGSGHFLLYAFDLLLIIYEEAWEDEDSPCSERTGRKLQEEYPDRDRFRREVPGLILRYNLHGIDIDARCAQIAALALWMRAQRAGEELGIVRSDRPRIQKTNVVVAEPMPGDTQIRGEFLASLEKRMGQLVRRVFELMDAAGAAGSLLRIEKEISDAVRSVYGEAGQLFGSSDRDRWLTAEIELQAALRGYVERSDTESSYQRKLFCQDAARGLGFIDTCRERYDVVLMNPPFGDRGNSAGEFTSTQLKASGSDIGAALVRRAALDWAPSGVVGALLSTGPWFKPAFKTWRRELFYSDDTAVSTAAHFGGEVLDGTTVSASPFVLSHRHRGPSSVFRLTRSDDLETGLHSSVSDLGAGHPSSNTFIVEPKRAGFLSGGPFCYWVSSKLRDTLSRMPNFEGHGGDVRTGLQTSDEPRFCRAWWEVPPGDSRWVPYAKSSPYSPFWDDYTWVELIGDELREVSAFSKSYVRGTDYFFRPGVTYPSKSVLGFNARLHPGGCGFAHSGCVAFPLEIDPLALLGFLSSRPVEYLISLFVGDLQGRAGVHPNQYEVGIVQRLPWPGIDPPVASRLGEAAAAAVLAAKSLDAIDEVTHEFRAPILDTTAGLAENYELALALESEAIRTISSSREEIDRATLDCYGFTASDTALLDESFEERTPPASGKWRIYFGEDGADLDNTRFYHRVVSWLLGIAMGRWGVEVESAATTSEQSQLLLAPSISSPAMSHRGLGARLLVDDPGHASDVTDSVLRALTASNWEVRAHELDSDDTPGPGGLRVYLSKKFFDLHRKQYSKTKRKAPIYWQLATPSATYSVWLYFHRLTRDTFYEVMNEFAEPKLRHEERKLTTIIQESGGNPTASQSKEIDAQERFVEELRVFRNEVARVAPLWNPNFNDGVSINFAPLWRLVPQHRAWQKECKKVWQKLCKGDYDWAHLAMHLWPERVVPKCAEDRSLAIAHDLEDAFWYEDSDGKWQPHKIDRGEVDELVNERTSAAVKDALKNLLEAPAPVTGRSSRKKSTRARAARRKSSSSRTTLATHGASARSKASAPDPELLSKVKVAISENGDGASKADIIAATGISAAQWNTAIKALLAGGSVTQVGERRGARYQVVNT